MWDNRHMPHLGNCLSRVARLLAGAAGVWLLQAGSVAGSAPAEALLKTGALVSPRREIADFSLLDQQGKPFTRARLRGAWSMLFFGYTSCPDICPATMATLAAFSRGLRSAGDAIHPQIIFVSLDAQRDTPAQLARYVPAFDADFLGVTAADQPTIAAVARQMGVFVMLTPRKGGSYNVDHSTLILVIDPAGEIAATLTGPFTAAALQGDFRRIVAGGP